MDYVRQIVNSNQLDQITLPRNLVNKRVEVIIFPAREALEESPKKTIQDFVGVFAEYQSPELAQMEKEAWGKAAVDKHGAR